MKKELKIILAEDDEGHATLIKRNLKRAGLLNEIIHLKDGQETLDYLFEKKLEKKRVKDIASLLLLDIKMPRVDGIEVLRRVKNDEKLKKMPVIMITTTDDPREIDKCHELGCSNYISKPIGYDKFVEAIQKIPRTNQDGNIVGTMGVARNITKFKEVEQKLYDNKKQLELRKNIAEAFVLEDKGKIFHDVLHLLLVYFNSKFGFFGYIDQAGDLVCPSMTYDIWDQCKVDNKSVVFPKENWTGLWGESLKTRKSLIKNKELKVPDGHVPLKNSIVGVIKFKGKLIGQLAFANRKAGYSTEDLQSLEEICRYISPLLNAELKEEVHKKELIAAKEKAEKNEKKINQNLQHLENLNNSLIDAVFTLNPENRKIRYVNIAVKEIFGYSPQDCLGLNSKFLYANEQDYEEFGKKLKVGISNNKNFLKAEMQLKRKNGEVFPAEIITSFLKEKGKILEILSVVRDVSEKINFQNELIKAKEKAEESDRLKSAFLANMSHEIRTPMNGIIGFTDLLKQPGLSGEKKNEFIDVIQKSGNRLLNTVTDLVDISKIEAGLVEVTKSDLNANDELESLYFFFLPEAEQKGLELSLEQLLPENSKIIQTDKTKFQSILTNLIKNALKYTQKGTIKIGSRLKNNQLEFYVKDTGVGIPKDRQQAVFDRFVQADIGDTRAYEGSGLGLSIVKAYAKMLDGGISLESEEGVGSTFYFCHPVNGLNKTALGEPKKEKQIRTELKKKSLPKILVAEDDEVSFEHLSIVLEKHVSELIHATNGEEVIQLSKQRPDIDIILMDIKMPVLNGYEATQRIRQFNKNVIIIAQTAYAMVGDRAASIKAGCNDYIAKPIKKDRLLEKISSHLNSRERT